MLPPGVFFYPFCIDDNRDLPTVCWGVQACQQAYPTNLVGTSLAITVGGVGCILATFGYSRIRKSISSSFYRFVSIFVVFPYNKGTVLWNDESVSKPVEAASHGIQSFRIPDRLLMSSRVRVRAVPDKCKTRKKHKARGSMTGHSKSLNSGKGYEKAKAAEHSYEKESGLLNQHPPAAKHPPRQKSLIERTSESLSNLSDKISGSLIRPYLTSSVSPPATPPPLYDGHRSRICSEESEDDDAVTSAERYDKRNLQQEVERSSIQMDRLLTEMDVARHYKSGGIVSYSGDCAALQRAATAARLQQVTSYSGELSSVASVGLDGPCPPRVRAIIPDDYLLQFGGLLEEPGALEALSSLGIPPACSGPGTLYGPTVRSTLNADAGLPWEWEPLVKDERPGLFIQAWRMPLRKGLFVYKTRVVIEGVGPSEVRPFHLDDHARELWDDGALSMRRTVQGASKHEESSIFVSVSKFPRPLAPRRYEYARRVWNRAYDGGCYAISQSCEEGEVWEREEERAVGVKEFVSCIAIKAVAGGTEVSTIYFEDSLVRPGLAKLAVPKGILPFWVKYVEALRVFAVARKERGLPSSEKNSAAGVESVDDDALFQALVELKERRQTGALLRLRARARWAKRIAIAAAIKTVHAVLFAEDAS